jgi:hypothetical protein
MLKRSLLIFLALSSISAVSLAAFDPPPVFVDAPSQELQPPPADKAQIVFLEPVNKVQGYFPVGIYELKGDQRTLLAITGAQTKTVLLVEPGQHRFMSTNILTKVHFLDATVEAGKRYYVLVRFIYNEGFQLRPIRPTGPSDFSMAGADWPTWVAGSPRNVVKAPLGDEEFAKPKPVKRIDKAYAKAVEAWNKKTDAEKAELTMTPADAAPL